MARPTEHLPLAGLRLLVTRPQMQAEKWLACLEAAGAECTFISLMVIEPLTDTAAEQKIKATILDLDNYQHVIFVSQNAVHYGLDWIERYWPQVPQGVNFYAVGSATATALQARDIAVIAAGNTMNTEALLARPELQQIAQQKVLILRGQGGRPKMAEELEAAGAQVDYCELYRRQFPQAAQVALQDWPMVPPVDAVAVHSGETLQNWRQVLDQLGRPGWQTIPVLVPGARVAALAETLGFTQIIESYNASDATMLATLSEWYRSR